jgi:hypothetical protein
MGIAWLVSTILIYKTTSKFLTEKFVIELSKKEHSVGDIPFPSLSVCLDLKISDMAMVLDEMLISNATRTFTAQE